MEMEKPIVHLVGLDSNAYNLIGICRAAARRAGWSKERIESVVKEMMEAGSYNNLLCIIQEHFDVE